MKDIVVINEKDNIGVSLKGTVDIPAGHKFALCDISKGQYIITYGELIGKAEVDIRKGEWVHTHNVRSHLDENVSYSYTFNAEKLKKASSKFMGYKRKNRRAGIRNEIYIIPTVGCVNNVCIRLEKKAQKYVEGNIDGIEFKLVSADALDFKLFFIGDSPIC